MPRREPSRTFDRLTRRVAAPLAVVLLGAAACSSNAGVDASGQPSTVESLVPLGDRPTTGGPKRGGKLVIAVSAETDSFNPYKGQWSLPSFTMANAFFDPLAAIDSQGIAHPNLAQGIDPGPGFLSWTITLRPNITFHDGTPLDANALKANLDYARSSGLTAQAFTTIRAVEVIDTYVVSVVMTEPWATFPATLASQAGFIASPAMFTDPAGNEATPIGTGPFKVVERVRDSSLRTVRNPTYWRNDESGQALPYLDAIEFKIVTDATSRNSALAAGDVDMISIVTPELLQSNLEAAQRGELQMITDAGQETDETVLALNASKPPFDDILARQIVSAAIDQGQLSEIAYQGAFPPAWGMFEEGSPYYVPPEDAGAKGHDVERGRSLAREYEQKHGKPLTFSALVPPDTQYLAIGQAIQQQLAEVGVKVELESIEQTQMIRRVVAGGDFEASGFVLRSAPSPDQSYIFLATKANPDGISLNFSRFDDDIVTSSMKDFRAAATPDLRVEALKRVQRQLAANVPMVFLVHNRSAVAYRNSIHGLQGTTFPGTQRAAAAPAASTPFFAAVWKD